MVQPVMSRSAEQLCITAENMDERLARAYLRGIGDEVLEVWRAIADNRLSRESQEIWTKKVADWIMTTAEPARRRPRVGFAEGEYFYRHAERPERVQVALATSGFAEPMLDTLNDERLLLDCAIELKSRDASENIWRLIASDKATRFLRDEWLSYVSNGVWKAVKRSAKGSDNANRRGDSMLFALGIFGKKATDTKKEKIRIFVGVMKLLGPSAYNVSSHCFTTLVVEKLIKCGVIDEDLKGKECGSACKRDPVSGVIGVQKGTTIPMV